MERRNKLIFASVIFVVILLTSAFCVAEFLNISTDTERYKAQVEKIFESAKVNFESMRNESLPYVPIQVVTRDWAIEVWGRGYASPDLTNILRNERIYKTLFLIPENASLYQANVDWAGYFTAATWNNQVYVVKENFDPWNLPSAEATLIHELTHIWQPRVAHAATFDGGKARTSLIEGDATFMADLFKTRSGSDASILKVNQVPVFLIDNPVLNTLQPSLPPAISKFNYFPYDYGKVFVETLYQQGGWENVNAAYSNPPKTTQQILHPEKYLLNQTAYKVETPQVNSEMWKQVKTDQYGEYFIQIMLANWVDTSQAQRVSEGWLGDKFCYYEQGEDFMFTWNIMWDSSCGASEFYVAFHNLADNGGGEKQNCTHWYSKGRFLSITWDHLTNSTLIVGSSVEDAVLGDHFC